MKNNHIPVTERLRSRISALQVRYDSGVGRKRSNPYNFCKGCGKHAPTISNEGHGKGCYVMGLRNEIKHYRKLLWAIEHNGDLTHFHDSGSKFL